MPMNDNNATTNAILVILLVLVVGFIVWFMVGRNSVPAGDDNTPNIQVDLNGGDNGTDSGAY
jgi:hypothetical protein